MSLSMLLRGMLVMTVRFKCVPVCHLVVMRRFVMIACLVSLMGFMVVVGRSFVMLCCVRMVIMLHVAFP
ncbi:MAG: hypothetical protein ACO27P_01185 [Burkholderiaceae bacterium]